ncbi:hypothetical protein BR93DRAFT_473468 [Coniochaeta sp. PMI_546]|nr:hypothetical protein BR93DRAFT_473468 [Coniochaeta sp. PMI_546]
MGKHMFLAAAVLSLFPLSTPKGNCPWASKEVVLCSTLAIACMRISDLAMHYLARENGVHNVKPVLTPPLELEQSNLGATIDVCQPRTTRGSQALPNVYNSVHRDDDEPMQNEWQRVFSTFWLVSRRHSRHGRHPRSPGLTPISRSACLIPDIIKYRYCSGNHERSRNRRSNSPAMAP